MVIFAMSRVAGCSINRRAFSRTPHRPAERTVSPLFSIAYKSAYTHESYLTVLFSYASGQYFGHAGVGGYALPSPSASSPFDPAPPRHIYSPLFSHEAPCT